MSIVNDTYRKNESENLNVENTTVASSGSDTKNCCTPAIDENTSIASEMMYFFAHRATIIWMHQIQNGDKDCK